MAKNDDLLAEAKAAYKKAAEWWSENHTNGLDDLKFARLGEQWPEEIATQRRLEGRPCLTINKLPAFIRQVVNDTRQNKPSIKVRPADSKADPQTAEIINDLIRNIEYTSNAEVAYDTGAESAVTTGVGYWRVGLQPAYEDSFDLDLTIERVANPFSILGDPNSMAADSSDWDVAFVLETKSKEEFEAQYPNAAKVNWETDFDGVGSPWLDGDNVTVAEYWTREAYDKEIVLLSSGEALAADDIAGSAELQALLAAGALTIVKTRTAKCHRVRQVIMTGAEVLEEREWPGQYIPIVPVYGDEVVVEGQRQFRSLIRDAKDAQRMFNYWRTTATELVALAPKSPWLVEEGAPVDPEKWATANRQSHAYLEYKRGMASPQRQPLDTGVAAGALQEALNASDDIKAIVGLYDASLGARSNETSGRAIIARQREGDVSTFHFQDNVSRAIRHTGRILIDLIPKVYTGERIIRVIGEDGTERTAPLNQPVPVTDPQSGQPMTQPDPMTGQQVPLTRIYDLSAGKYDLTVTTGPSFTTRREEAAAQMTEMIRAFPQAAVVIGPELAKNLDWPGADKIAQKLEAMAGGGIPPEVQKQIQQGQQQLQQLTQENQQLKADKSADIMKAQADAELSQAQLQLEGEKIALERAKLELERQKIAVQQYEAETARLQALKPEPQPSPFPPRKAT